MILCRFRMFLFYALNSSHFMFEFLLLNKMSLNSLKSVVILTPFTVLDSLPSIFFMEYIFDFNQTNSAITFSSDPSFILRVTFLLVSSKNFESFGWLLKSNKCLCLKILHKHLLILFHK